jgi:hypothetical protein
MGLGYPQQGRALKKRGFCRVSLQKMLKIIGRIADNSDFIAIFAVIILLMT